MSEEQSDIWHERALRSEAEAARAASERLLQSLTIALSTSRLGAWQLDLATLRVECSERCRSDFALPLEGPLSLADVKGRIAPGDWAELGDQVRQAIDEQQDCDREIRVIGPAGEVRWLLVRGRALYDAEGVPQHIVGVTLDMTERRRAEERQRLLSAVSDALASSLDVHGRVNALARSLVPHLADWCAIDLLDARDRRPSRLAEAAADSELGEQVRASLARVPLGFEHADQPIARVLRSGRAELVASVGPDELAALSPDPARWAQLRELNMQSYLVVPMLSRGRVIGAISLLLLRAGRRYGPADQALAEEVASRAALLVEAARLYAARQAAAGRATRLHAVTAALARARTLDDVSMATLRNGGRALGARAGIVTMLDSSGTTLEIVGSIGYDDALIAAHRYLPLAALLPLCEATRAGELVLLESREAAMSRYPALAELHMGMPQQAWANVPLLLQNGALGALELGFITARSFSPEDRSFLLTLSRQCAQSLDRARLYEAERQARAEAEVALRARDTFFSVAAHELKTPLTSLLGQAQLLQRRLLADTAADPRYLRSIEVVVGQATRLSRTVTALLDLSRIEAGRLSIERQPVELAALTRQIIAEIEPSLTRHRILYTQGSAPLVVLGDALRLEQVIQNLVSNAIKYSPAGGQIEISLDRQGERACLSVRDYGIGIAPDIRAQLYSRFFRPPSDADQHSAGMGVGLYLVREIVALHNGEISVESAVGAGSTFTVLLPLAGAQTQPV